VLDVGCGSGDHAIALARRSLEVVGVDSVQEAITQAQAKAQALPAEIAERLTFHVADALRPSLLGRRFGAVVDSGFLHLFAPQMADGFAAERGWRILALHEALFQNRVAATPATCACIERS
jgi:ubiquinone/menaquinone biosynthesis C-methylase UbiE